MKYRIFIMLFLIGCMGNISTVTLEASDKNERASSKVSKKKSKVKEVTSSSSTKKIIGSVELVRVVTDDIVLTSRIDTGAETTSINAIDIQLFERDGREFVHFRLSEDENSSVIDKPVLKYVKIKRHAEESQTRPVVKLRLVLGDFNQVVLVTLTDRSKFEFPLLIGRNFLRDNYLVDVSKTMTTKPIEYKK